MSPPSKTPRKRRSSRGWRPLLQKKKSAEAVERPQVCWPEALRAVRGWLEPWILLRRFWRAWSQAPPPLPLQHLLDWLWQGNRLFLYEPP
jgi:hypothetical protein